MSAAPAEPAEPAVPGRRRGRGTARRAVYDAESLLAVAVAEFNTRGYDATSMEDLSRAAGITKSSFYHHISGKEELLRSRYRLAKLWLLRGLTVALYVRF